MRGTPESKAVRERFKREYHQWCRARAACRKPTHEAYSKLGGRGISLVDHWQVFANFMMDMGPCPKGHILRRFDESKNFEPGNCEWRDKKLNVHQNSRLLTYKGETHPCSYWARYVGIHVGTLHHRLSRNWTVEDALERPVMNGLHEVEYQGETHLLRDLARERDLDMGIVRHRLDKGDPIEEALRPVLEAKLIEFDGRKQRVSEWARGLGLSPSAMGERLKNWPLEEAMTRPIHEDRRRCGRKDKVEWRGRLGYVADHARDAGLIPTTVYGRIKKGWSLEKALSTLTHEPKPRKPKLPPPDYTGEKYHDLTAIRSANPEHRRAQWIWRCDCGKEITARRSDVRHGEKKSCGCGIGGKKRWEEAERKKEHARMTELIDQKFGKLTAMTYIGASWWVCICECGAEEPVRGDRLKSGKRTTCQGCRTEKRGGSLKATAASLRKANAKLYSEMGQHLDIQEISHKFEHVIAPYIYDLVLYDLKTLVEFDGPHHSTRGQQKRDAYKDAAARRVGWTVHRITTGVEKTLSPLLLEGII